MNRFLLFVVTVGLALVSSELSASSYVWKDPANGFSVAFPDSWQMQNNNMPNMVIKVSSPIDEDVASCSVSVAKDGRLNGVPKELMTQAVTETVGYKFWLRELGKYKDSAFMEFYTPTNMGGQGDATGARISYTQNIGEVKEVDMYATMIVSIYDGRRYLAICSSRVEQFDKYTDIFSSIISSIKLDQRYAPFATGYYRDFLSGKSFSTMNEKPGTRPDDMIEDKSFVDKAEESVQEVTDSFSLEPLKALWPF